MSFTSDGFILRQQTRGGNPVIHLGAQGLRVGVVHFDAFSNCVERLARTSYAQNAERLSLCLLYSTKKREMAF